MAGLMDRWEEGWTDEWIYNRCRGGETERSNNI